LKSSWHLWRKKLKRRKKQSPFEEIKRTEEMAVVLYNSMVNKYSA
jgi:hypothetical protein